MRTSAAGSLFTSSLGLAIRRLWPVAAVLGAYEYGKRMGEDIKKGGNDSLVSLPCRCLGSPALGRLPDGAGALFLVSRQVESAFAVDKPSTTVRAVRAFVPVMQHLVGVAEIAKMLNVTRQRVDQLVRESGFPAPEAILTAGRIWKRVDVEEWARRTGRL